MQPLPFPQVKPMADDTGMDLLVTLSYLRDVLTGAEGQTDGLEPERALRCREVADLAFDVAATLEKNLIYKSLRLQEMERVASTDELTGALNRRGFEREFARVLDQAQRFGETGVLVYVDLDDFKPVNDTFGHAAGDAMLIETARLLSALTRAHDSVARLGGDEFAVILTRTGWEDGLKRAEDLSEKLNTASVDVDGRRLSICASFGFQRFGPDDDAQSLLKAADAAMYEVKKVRAAGSNKRRTRA